MAMGLFPQDRLIVMKVLLLRDNCILDWQIDVVKLHRNMVEIDVKLFY